VKIIKSRFLFILQTAKTSMTSRTMLKSSHNRDGTLLF